MPEHYLSENLLCEQVSPADTLLFYEDQRPFQC